GGARGVELTERSSRSLWWALAPILLFAFALRVWRIGQGLPFLYDEAIPFRRALEMWTLHGTDWNPHFFHYPSLTIYLCLAIQKLVYLDGHARGLYANPSDFLLRFEIDPTPVVLPARWVFVLLDLVTVATTIVIGERLRRGAGALAGWVAALAPVLVTTSYRLSADTALAAFAMLALERALAWSAEPSRGRLVASAALVGLAAGAKYPGAALLAPLAVIVLARRRWAGVGDLVGAAAIAAVVFLATTPFALLDFPAFRRDVDFVWALAATGRFGTLRRLGLASDVRALVSQIGPIGAAALALSPLLLLRRPALERGALWIALLGFFVPAALAHVESSRYLLPVVPIALVLATDA